MLAVFHGVDNFQRVVVDLQPTDGWFGCAGQGDHLYRDDDVLVGIFGEGRGDAGFGLVRDGEGGQFVQRAVGEAIQGDIGSDGGVEDCANANQGGGRNLGQHFVLYAHV